MRLPPLFSWLWLVVGIFVCGGINARALGQEPEPVRASDVAEVEEAIQDIGDDQDDGDGIVLQANGKIRFQFVDAPWSEVIKFFADQAGFSLQPIETEPDGTFKYHDDQEYTVMEALDQLNYALGLRGYTLVRNKRLLVLVSTERNIPDDLIETVGPEELDQRGKHEILKCVFDLEGLEDAGIDQQIEGLISRQHNDAFHVVPSANQMIVREKGQTLRTIRSLLDAARTRYGESRFIVRRHQLEHIDPESVLEAARVLLDLDERNQSEDGQFKVMVQPLSTELIFRGSPNRVKQFETLLSQLDVPGTSALTTAVERPYLKQYPVSGDLDMAFKVIQTMLANRDVRFDIDKSTGKAILLGREDDHRRLTELLDELSSSGDDFAVVDLKYMTTSKAMTILDQLYQRDKMTGDEVVTQGPVFFADETNSRLIVKGTPQEVSAVKRYLEQLDVEISLNLGPRSNTRILSLDSGAVTPEMIEDLFSTTGLENRLQIFMPKDLRPRGALNEIGPLPTDSEPPPPPPSNSDSSGSLFRPAWSVVLASVFSGHSPAGGMLTWQEPTQDEPVVSDQEDEKPSVPGAPIEIKITDYGIVLRSDDLDALDTLETLLRNQYDELSATSRPAVFYLKYRDPKDAKTILEKLIGQGSSSSGGSDPLSSLIGAGVNNMIPGMGDLFGGLGGATSSSGAVFEMEGPVVVLADRELRALIVGASARDLAIIAPLVTDYIDQPGAPHDPQIQGEFYAIPVIHRDPSELKLMLETMLPDLVRTEADSDQAGQNQSPEQQILQRIMQARGGQQQAEEELKSPKAVLGVDTKGRALLVSGPPFIHEQILKIVKILDSPELGESSYLIMPLEGRNAELLARSLRASLGDKIEISENQTGTPPNQNQTTPNTPQGIPLGAQQAQQAEQARNAMLQAIQQQMNRGQRGQGQRGGRGGDPRGGRQGGGQDGPRIFAQPGGG